MTKYQEIHALFEVEDFDILFLEESTNNVGCPQTCFSYNVCNHRGAAGGLSGGITVWVNESVCAKRRRDLEPSASDGRVDAIFIEVQRKSCKNVIVGGIYINPADNFIKPVEYLDKTVGKIINENKRVILGGDWNARIADLGNRETNVKGRRVKTLAESNLLELVHDKKTPGLARGGSQQLLTLF